MQIHKFTRIEADYLQIVCNFSEEESTLFEMRLRDVSLESCAERMNMSVPTVKRLSQNVNSKIGRVL